MKNEKTKEPLTEDVIFENEALVEEILASQSGAPMTAEEFSAWLDSQT